MSRNQAIVPGEMSLDTDTMAFLSQKAGEIKSRMQRTALDVCAIGSALLEVKARLKHGQFLHWIESEFSMSFRTAQRFMAVADRFAGKSDSVAHLPVNVLYLLSSGKVSDEEVDEVVSGKRSVSSVRQAEAQEEKTIEDYAFDGVSNLYWAWMVSPSDDEFVDGVMETILAFQEAVNEDIRQPLLRAIKILERAIQEYEA